MTYRRDWNYNVPYMATMVIPDLKRFDGVYLRGDDRIGINRSGLIRLSSSFCRKTKIKEEFRYVVLFFSPSKRVIALKFTKNGNEKGVMLVVNDGKSATVSGLSFAKTYGLNLDEIAGRYPWEKTNLEGLGDVYMIDLNKK